MERIKLGLALAAVIFVAPVAQAAIVTAPAAGLSQVMPAAYNGDPYSPHKGGGGRKAHASKKTPEPPADLSKGETPEQHKAYLKKYGF